jgi:hypothetical protein
MRFQVPQFINIEDKLFGPFTIKQFVYMVGAAGAGYIVWHFLPKILALIIIAPIVTLALLLAFVRPNGQPFVFLLQSAVLYGLSNRLYLWKKVQKKVSVKKLSEDVKAGSGVPALSESKLKDLTWALDINQNVKGKK